MKTFFNVAPPPATLRPPPQQTNTGVCGDPGLPPHKTNTGFCEDPGVESAKSIISGLTGDRGWDEAIAKIANIRGFSGQVAPCTVVGPADQDPPSADYVGERAQALVVVEKAKQGK